MSKELVLISVQPDDLLFAWQIEVQLCNFRKFGLSKKARVLVFLPYDRRNQGFNPIWKKLEDRFPETKFFYYEDKDQIPLHIYIPILRLYCLKEHFKEHPELSERAIFYHDSDIIFTRDPTFLDDLKDDDICYLSDTTSYIGAKYFEDKRNDINPQKAKAFEKMDVLDLCTRVVGINKQIAIDNQNNSGGAQYLLKNINSKFWEKAMNDCLEIRVYLRQVINPNYFRKDSDTSPDNWEDRGYQSWCADMWAVLWNLWFTNHETRCPKEMNFAWATDHATLLPEIYIYHDAGGSDHEIEYVEPDGSISKNKLFNKRKIEYVNNERTPFEDIAYLSEISSRFCSSVYAEAIRFAARARLSASTSSLTLIT